MEVAINTGIFNEVNVTYQNQTHSFLYAYPFTDCNQKINEQLTDFKPYSLSLNDVCENSLGHRFRNLTKLNTKDPFTIYFTAKRIPDPKKVFIIGNQKYVCDHININISKSEIEPIYEGTFYRID